MQAAGAFERRTTDAAFADRPLEKRLAGGRRERLAGRDPIAAGERISGGLRARLDARRRQSHRSRFERNAHDANAFVENEP
jgi:hypothetical protein